MKIAWLHSHFMHWMGGTKFIYEVVTRLPEDADVELFVEKASPKVTAMFEAGGVPVRSISNRSSDSLIYWLLFPYFVRRDLKALRSLTREHDLVVANMFPMNWVASRLGKKAAFYCYEPFAFFYDEAMIKGFAPVKRVLVKVLRFLYSGYDRAGTRGVDKVLTLNEITAAAIRKIYGVDSVVTYSGVDIEFFTPTDDPELRAEYTGKVVLAHTTDYSPIKGTSLVIKAFAEIKQAIPNAVLLITSPRDDRSGKSKLEMLVRELSLENDVRFLGFVAHDMMPKLFSLAAVVLQGGYSNKSGGGTSSLPSREALACGTPVVRIGLEGEAPNDFEVFVDPRRTQEYAAAVVAIIKDPVKAAEMGRLGRADVEEKYTWGRVVVVIWSTLENVASQRK